MATDESNEENPRDRELQSWVDDLEAIESGLKENKESVKDIFGVFFGGRNGPTDLDEFGERLKFVIDSNAEEDQVEEAIGVFLRCVISAQHLKNELIEYGLDKEVVQLIVDLFLNYSDGIERVSQRNYQGKRWWSDINSEIVIRGTEVGFTHQFTIDQKDEIEITTNMSSSLEIVNHILRQHNQVIENFGEAALEDYEDFAYETFFDEYKRFAQHLVESDTIPVGEKDDG